jgi:hypothetical protein
VLPELLRAIEMRAGPSGLAARIRKLPLPVLVMLDGGPTADFILGRIFESAMQYTTQQLFEASNNKETQKIIAGQNFAKQNCGLLVGDAERVLPDRK